MGGQRIPMEDNPMPNGESLGDTEQVLSKLFDAASVSEQARQEATVDETAEIAYIPPEALREITRHVHSVETNTDGGQLHE